MASVLPDKPTLTPITFDLPQKGQVKSVFTPNFNNFISWTPNFQQNLQDAIDWMETVSDYVEAWSATVEQTAVEVAQNAALAEEYRDSAVEAKNLAEAAVASLPEGTIDDLITSETTTWSSYEINKRLATAGGVQEFTASGSIPDGRTVRLNGDGTVSVISGVPTEAGTSVVFNSASTFYISATFDSISNKVVIAYTDNGNSNYGTAVVGTVSGTSITFGTPVVFESASVTYISATFDSISNKVVIAYTDNGNSSYGTAVVGTVSGTSITFGTPVVFESANCAYTTATFDSNSNKVVIAYADGNSFYGTAVVGTVSGTSITFGTPVVFESASSIYTTATFDSNSNKVVITYRDNGNSSYGTAVVGTVSGTSITFGTPVVFESAGLSYISATFDSISNKVVIAYTDNGNSNYGTAVVGTVSGTSITFGTPVVFESASVTYISATFDSISNKVVIAYTDNGNSSYGTAVVGTVSGTSITFGTPVVFESAGLSYISATFDSISNKVVIAYTDNGNSNYGTAVVGTVSGTSITFGTPVVFESANCAYTTATFDSNSNKVVITYRDNGNSSYGTATVLTPEQTNADTYIGISASSANDSETVQVTTLAGVSNQSVLTPNTYYYVDFDGDIEPYNTGYSLVGKAIAVNKLLLTTGGA